MCQFVLIHFRCDHTELATGPVCQAGFAELSRNGIDTAAWGMMEDRVRAQVELPEAVSILCFFVCLFFSSLIFTSPALFHRNVGISISSNPSLFTSISIRNIKYIMIQNTAPSGRYGFILPLFFYDHHDSDHVHVETGY